MKHLQVVQDYSADDESEHSHNVANWPDGHIVDSQPQNAISFVVPRSGVASG